MKYRQAYKIFVYGPIKWNVPKKRWKKAVYRIFKRNETRKGWINLMNDNVWEFENNQDLIQ